MNVVVSMLLPLNESSCVKVCLDVSACGLLVKCESPCVCAYLCVGER